jgi:hypothetical protein
MEDGRGGTRERETGGKEGREDGEAKKWGREENRKMLMMKDSRV